MTDMKNDKFENITDEKLAAFIEGVSSEDEVDAVLDAVQTREDLELLALALSAKEVADEIFHDEDAADSGKQPAKKVKLRPFNSLPMAGFLGEESGSDDPEDSDNE